MVVYLLRQLCRGLVDVIQESDVRSDSLLANAQQVQAVLEYLKHEETVHRLHQEHNDLLRKGYAALAERTDTMSAQEMAAARDRLDGLKFKAPALPLERGKLEPLLTLGQRLHKAGLPWRSVNSNATDTARPPLPSVESVLLHLTKAEASLIQCSLWMPPDGASGELWDGIAGMDAIKERIRSIVSTVHSDPTLHTHAFESLFGTGRGQSSTVGLLLYGPPGCGKTLLVRGLASQARWPCLVITPSVLLHKYVGETNQVVRAIFTLAAKLAPCIVCMDELDGIFRERSDREHEVSRDLKTEFLQWLDGMPVGTTTTEHGRHKVLVIGATNRPFDVDSALLRRLPHSIFVDLPNAKSRLHILQKLLATVPTAPDLDVTEIAECWTDRYSPSDLKHLLQTAALSGPMMDGSGVLSERHIYCALDVVHPTIPSPLYRHQLQEFMKQQPGDDIPSSIPSSTWTKFAPSAVTPCEGGSYKWETTVGNFYDVGTLEMDASTLDIIKEVLEERFDWENMDDDDDM